MGDVRGWPEEGRRVVAEAFFLIFAILLFVLWSENLGKNLSAISQANIQTVTKTEESYDETSKIPGPLVGIAETLGAIKEIFK